MMDYFLLVSLGLSFGGAILYKLIQPPRLTAEQMREDASTRSEWEKDWQRRQDALSNPSEAGHLSEEDKSWFMMGMGLERSRMNRDRRSRGPLPNSLLRTRELQSSGMSEEDAREQAMAEYFKEENENGSFQVGTLTKDKK